MNFSPAHAPETILARWLWLVLGMVLVMVGLGGVTRLTGSGLSIVEWNVLVGTLPPLNAQDWAELYAKYQTSPEYLKINAGMSLDQFKDIFWLEYIHRLWGRLMGVVILVPLVLAWRHQSLRGHVPKILGVIALGGLQGAAGWFMVKSGLVEDPHVSPYRLMLHLLLALLIVAFLAQMALSLSPEAKNQKNVQHTPLMSLTLSLATVTIAYGALVAGFKAGLIYNTFPLMGEAWIPAEILDHQPWWRNFIDNPTTIQFIHRCLAITTFSLCWLVALRDLDKPSHRVALIGVSTAQLLLGIFTLLHQVPVALAASHQLGAFALWLTLWGLYLKALPTPQRAYASPDVSASRVSVRSA